MPEVIRGTIQHVYFASPSFSAGVMETEDVSVKFKGAFHANVGDVVALDGKWEHHTKYGRQFAAKGLSYDLPDTPEGLVRYLANQKIFKGIGEATAGKLVDYAGSADRLDSLIRNNPDELRVALRIPQKTLEILQAQWVECAAQNKVRAYLSSFELTPHQIGCLLEKFGEGVVGVLKGNPYALIGSVDGYGFKRVDKIARKMGIKKTHAGRISAGLKYVVQEEINSGHTWIDAGDLIHKANELLIMDGLDSLEIIRKSAKELVADGDLVAEGHAVTIPSVRDDERFIIDTFNLHAHRPGHEVKNNNAHTDGLLPGQLNAFITALSKRIVTLSGSAGTGKTVVLSRIVSAFSAQGMSVAVCAPTGKAAKRAEELLRGYGSFVGAKTIHRLLGYGGYGFRVEYIDADVVAVDECSMVSIDLMAELLRRIDFERTTLLLVGDHNQLPPVGPGSILRDTIKHKLTPMAMLTDVVRQAGVLKANATAVLSGKIAQTDPSKRKWLLIDKFKDPLAIQSCLRDLVRYSIPNHLGFDPLQDVQILSPTHRGALGTKEINRMMQYIHHGQVDGRFTAGDRVVQKKNNYDLEIFNGSIGTVLMVSKKGLLIEFDLEGERELTWESAGALKLAYCLTIHSMQGSEAPCVVLLLHKSHWHACRQLIYTGITRATKTLILLGDRWGIQKAVKNTRAAERRTLIDYWSVNRAILTPAGGTQHELMLSM